MLIAQKTRIETTVSSFIFICDFPPTISIAAQAAKTSTVPAYNTQTPPLVKTGPQVYYAERCFFKK
jgi:hypothetical protein